MLDIPEDRLVTLVDGWLASFEKALSESGAAGLAPLFHDDCHWRDLLAFTWHLQTRSGVGSVAAEIARCAPQTGAAGFRTARDRTPPRRVTRAGVDTVEAIFEFETARGPASGVLRLLPDAANPRDHKAWTLLTSLDDLSAAESEPAGATDEPYARVFGGPNWLDERKAAAAYDDRDPAVLVVGGGQAGLSVAARLNALRVDTLVVDRGERIGDNWRKRYHALKLHNQVHVNHLPYMPFPPNFPTYIPKDMLAGWFEAYAQSLEINFWTGTVFAGGTYDAAAGRWTVTLRRADGTSREMQPRHVVMATGVSGIPSLPDIPSLAQFRGEVVHSSAYDSAADWSGRKVIIVGTGNSAHDIAQDLHAAGAEVTMVQRSPTTIVNVEPSAQLPYTLYKEGPPLDDCDLIAASMPFRLLRKTHQLLTEKARDLDRKLIDDLTRVGFRIDFGEDGTGWQFKYMRRGGGYYFNVGCSDLIVAGEVKLIQFDDIDAFVADGARMKTGETRPADLVVLATGYKGQEHLVRLLFGAEVAERVGPIWGFDEAEQELRNMWVRTGQPGLWFIAGSFAQCRIFSKYLGLQIKACEDGLIPLRREPR